MRKLLWPLTFLLVVQVVQGSRLPAEEFTGTWNQWRGPTRDGHAEAADWPNRLSDDVLVESWRVPLGASYSGPIVGEDLVFVTETVNQSEESVRALDRATGQQRWEVRWQGSIEVPFFAKSNGDWIRATPAHDGQRLYVAGMRDVLVCLDAQTGDELWRVDFTERYGSALPAFGCVSSPLVAGDHVYVQAGAGFCKLDKHTGESIWRTLVDSGGMMDSAFSSPVLTELAGQTQLLVQTRAQLCGVDPASGQVLWSQDVPAFRGMNILTPTVHEDGVLTSAYGGRTFFYHLTAASEKLHVTPAWEEKAQGYMSSPVVVDGHAYLHLRNRRFCCFDLKTGNRTWTTTPFGEYWSIVAQGDKMLALDERGELLLIRANPAEYTQLDSRKISEQPTWAHLAVCGGEVFIRELHAMSAYKWREPNEKPPLQ